jgi:hypothetical protein
MNKEMTPPLTTKAQAKKGNDKKKKGSKPFYNTTSNYDSLPSNHAFTSVHGCEHQVESSSEEEQDEDDEDKAKEYDIEQMTLFIKKFNKYISKRRPFKGDKNEKTGSKRVCYNCGKNGHFIAQYPYERKYEDDDKKKKKGYKKDKKFLKKKSYCQAHIGQE